MNTNVVITRLMLKDLERKLPAAMIVGRLEQWSRIYTEGYMLLLRSMR